MGLNPKQRAFLFEKQKNASPVGGMAAPKPISSLAPPPGVSIPGALNGGSAMAPSMNIPKQNVSSAMPAPANSKFKKLKGFLGGA